MRALGARGLTFLRSSVMLSEDGASWLPSSTAVEASLSSGRKLRVRRLSAGEGRRDPSIPLKMTFAEANAE